MGVQVPPFALTSVLVLLLLAGISACSGRESGFIDEQKSHLNNLVRILADHPGDTDGACDALDRYLLDNEKRLIDARLERIRLMEGMSPADREAFVKMSNDALGELRQRLMTQVKTFPEPGRIMYRVRQLFL